jgi:hypothetical protein
MAAADRNFTVQADSCRIIHDTGRLHFQTSQCYRGGKRCFG